MLKFLIGYIVGGIVGFIAAAVLSIHNTEKGSTQSTPISKEAEDNSNGDCGCP